ncbi:hypothetical protein [Bradyrhizobium japonicum]|uniref:hypothetical protein n=1 Tax=Bradyrhizobium japonicum TaxID=375 RepID=UPI0012BBFE07|nr:hypothetical protein [Bradyrhizobium japonicum]
MHHQARLDSQPGVRPRPGTNSRAVAPIKHRARDRKRRPKPSTDELAFRTLAVFRAHPHINNVLTHISRADWTVIERSLASILDPATTSDALSPLEQNIIDLMCADRGITGRILKPYFHALLHRLLEPRHAERMIRHVELLFLEIEWKAQQPTSTSPVQRNNPPTEESGHVRNESQ